MNAPLTQRVEYDFRRYSTHELDKANREIAEEAQYGWEVAQTCCSTVYFFVTLVRVLPQ